MWWIATKTLWAIARPLSPNFHAWWCARGACSLIEKSRVPRELRQLDLLAARSSSRVILPYMSGVPQNNPQKTFYLETFGCQMNVHDSEKVVGTLVQEGYRQVETVEQADLVLYNTCSIRDKAEQKVFNRLSDYKKYKKQGKTFGVLGCVAQQEGEKIFERAPYVSLVCGSASYRKLPAMLVQIQAGGQRVTGLDDRLTDECFETEVTAPTHPQRGGIPNI